MANHRANEVENWKVERLRPTYYFFVSSPVSASHVKPAAAILLQRDIPRPLRIQGPDGEVCLPQKAKGSIKCTFILAPGEKGQKKSKKYALYCTNLFVMDY